VGTDTLEWLAQNLVHGEGEIASQAEHLAAARQHEDRLMRRDGPDGGGKLVASHSRH